MKGSRVGMTTSFWRNPRALINIGGEDSCATKAQDTLRAARDFSRWKLHRSYQDPCPQPTKIKESNRKMSAPIVCIPYTLLHECIRLSTRPLMIKVG